MDTWNDCCQTIIADTSSYCWYFSVVSWEIIVSQAWVKVWQVLTSHLDTSFCLFLCSHLFRENLDFCDRGSPLVIRSHHTNPKGISIDFIKVKVIHFPSFELIRSFEIGHWFPVGIIVEDMLFAFDKARILRCSRHGLASIILDHVGFRSPNAVIFVEGYIQIVYCPLGHNTRISKENAH